MAADTPQGDDWWQASDGKWYPPADKAGAATAAGVATPAAPAIDSASGFFGRLFDTSFRTFMTPSILKVLFWLGVAVATIYSLGILVVMAQGGGAGVLIGILLAPIVWIVMVLYTRVLIELAVVFFRIEENTRT